MTEEIEGKAMADVQDLAFSDAQKRYIVDVLDPHIEELVERTLMIRPPEPVSFMIMWLRSKHGDVVPVKSSVTATNDRLKKELETMSGFVQEVGEGLVIKREATEGDAKSDASSEEEEEDDEEEDPPLPPPPASRGPRQSVSAEAYGQWNVEQAFVPPVHEKSEEQKERIRTRLQASFLFKNLETKDMETVVNAFEEVAFQAGARIITEGEDGMHLYLIEEGSPSCTKVINGTSQVVKEYSPGDVFGELALLYNAPRAATVDATDLCKCWQLDRQTFNAIIKASNTRSTIRQDSFLQNVSLFLAMDALDRSQLMYGLKAEYYVKGDFVVKQGDSGEKFYIVEEGNLVVMKSKGGEAEQQVMEYSPGNYFGELALIKNKPRAASVVVTSEKAKLLTLDRKTFNKLMGPLENLLKTRVTEYVGYEDDEDD